MGEILRAILDKNAVWSQSAFYGATIRTTSTIVGVKTVGRRQTSFACKQDTYFLAMGAAQTSMFQGAGAQGTNPKTRQTTFQIVRGSNGEAFSIAPQVKCNQNFNFNNFALWDEYILFQPGELITLNEDVMVGDIALVLNHTTWVTMLGVEYRF